MSEYFFTVIIICEFVLRYNYKSMQNGSETLGVGPEGDGIPFDEIDIVLKWLDKIRENNPELLEDAGLAYDAIRRITAQGQEDANSTRFCSDRPQVSDSAPGEETVARNLYGEIIKKGYGYILGKAKPGWHDSLENEETLDDSDRYPYTEFAFINEDNLNTGGNKKRCHFIDEIARDRLEAGNFRYRNGFRHLIHINLENGDVAFSYRWQFEKHPERRQPVIYFNFVVPRDLATRILSAVREMPRVIDDIFLIHAPWAREENLPLCGDNIRASRMPANKLLVAELPDEEEFSRQLGSLRDPSEKQSKTYNMVKNDSLTRTYSIDE